jgi:hypothetical protein
MIVAVPVGRAAGRMRRDGVDLTVSRKQHNTRGGPIAGRFFVTTAVRSVAFITFARRLELAVTLDQVEEPNASRFSRA